MNRRRDIFDQAMSRGHNSAWDQDWDQAIAAYSEALQEFPDDPTGLSSLGLALLQTDQLERALGCYQRAASLSPGDPLAPEKCGEIFERQGRLNEAAQTFLAVAEIHLRRRDIQKAMDNWQRVARLTPDNLAAHSRLALAAERTGNKALAVREYLEVGRIFQRAGDHEKAAAAIGRAQAVDPQALQPQQALDKLKRGQALTAPPKAAATPKPGPKAADDATVDDAHPSTSPLQAGVTRALALLASLLFEDPAESGKAPASMGTLTAGTAKMRGNAARRSEAMRALGQAINSQTSGDVPAAIAHYQEAMRSGLESPVIEFVIGSLHLEQNKRAEAIKWLGRATQHEAVGAGALFGLGQAEHQAGRTAQAAAHLLDSLRRLDLELVAPSQRDALDEAYESLAETMQHSDPAALTSVITAITKLLTGRDWEARLVEARRQLDDGARDGSPTPLAELAATPGADVVMDSMRLIERHMQNGLWAIAMEEAYFAIARSPGHLPTHVRMAEILAGENKHQAAVDKYAIVAETYRMRGQSGRAASIMQRALRLTPLDVSMRAWLIELLVEQGHVESALEQYDALADTYYQLTDLGSARACLAEALALVDQHRASADWRVRLLHRMGDIDLQRLNWREALQVYERIRDAAPDDHTGRATLIDLLYRMGNSGQALVEIDNYVRQLLSNGSVATAVGLLEEINQSQPDEIPLISRLARLYQETGQRDMAITQYDRLGEIQLQAGLTSQAAETIRSILSLEPAEPDGYEQLLSELEA